MVELIGVSKRLGGREVLRSVDLCVRPGRVLAVLGPNGAGKSTILKAVVGLVHPDAGRVLIDGRPVSDTPESRASIGYMPQIARFQGNTSAADLVAMVADLRPDDQSIAGELIDRFDLHGEMSKPLRTLSGGNRQKVNALLALMFRPAVLLLDEPTASLDAVAAAMLKDRVRSERDAGRICLLATHVLGEVEELADDVAYLHDGTFHFVGPVVDLKHHTRQTSIERAIARLMMERAA